MLIESDELSKCTHKEYSKLFREKKALIKHVKRLHTDKAHLCTGDNGKCKKAFATATELNIHISRKHKPEEVYLVCDYCLKKQPCKISKREHEKRCSIRNDKLDPGFEERKKKQKLY